MASAAPPLAEAPGMTMRPARTSLAGRSVPWLRTINLTSFETRPSSAGDLCRPGGPDGEARAK